MLDIRRAAKLTELATFMQSEDKPGSSSITSLMSFIETLGLLVRCPSLIMEEEKAGMTSSVSNNEITFLIAHALSG